VGTGAEGEPNPNRQNDQDDRADDSCGSEESHRDFIHWRIFTASWAFSPVRDFLFLAKNLFVAATERGLRKHFAHFQFLKVTKSSGPTLPALCEAACKGDRLGGRRRAGRGDWPRSSLAPAPYQ
jgi:hypothetical protein